MADIGRGRKFRVGDGDILPEPFARGGCKAPLSTVPLSLPLATWPSPTVLSPRLENGISGPSLSRSFILGLGESGLGGATALILSFEFAICSKWERREDTGFCNTLSALCEIAHICRRDRLTMDVSSRLSTPGSSILSSSKNEIQL